MKREYKQKQNGLETAQLQHLVADCRAATICRSPENPTKISQFQPNRTCDILPQSSRCHISRNLEFVIIQSSVKMAASIQPLPPLLDQVPV